VRDALPDATVRRLPLYLQCLEATPGARTYLSSEEVAARAGVNAAKVRKDLSYLGCSGVRGVGYRVADLQAEIRRELGLTRDRPMVIVGIGNLGRALANFAGFASQGFRVVGLFDADPATVGGTVHGVEVEPIEALPAAVRDRRAVIGVITTPAAAAQGVADVLAGAGVEAILNFAPVVVRVPPPVEVRRVDLSNELRVLAYHAGRAAGREPAEPGGDQPSPDASAS
jgi:redox-sensing transcriptional repressor